MTTDREDRTGAPVTVDFDEGRPIGRYTVRLADGTLAGRADFIDAREADGERIFFHTEIAPELSGRGLAGLLVREALADSIRRSITVVPVCPLFVAHLKEHGDQYVARSEEHTSELQSLMRISYAVFCLKKNTPNNAPNNYVIRNGNK